MAGWSPQPPQEDRQYYPNTGQVMTRAEYQAWVAAQQAAEESRYASSGQKAAHARQRAASDVGSMGGTATVGPSGETSYEIGGPAGSLAGLRASASGKASSGVGVSDAVSRAQMLEDEQRHLTQEAEAEKRRAGLQTEAEQRRFAMFGGNQSQARVQPSAVDTSAQRAAVFARAKDQAGQIARSSLNSLYDLMAATGRSGSNIEAGMSTNLLGDTAGGLGNVTREQAIQDAQMAQRGAETAYQGDITQRGQDLSRMQSLMSLITQRGIY